MPNGFLIIHVFIYTLDFAESYTFLFSCIFKLLNTLNKFCIKNGEVAAMAIMPPKSNAPKICLAISDLELLK